MKLIDLRQWLLCAAVLAAGLTVSACAEEPIVPPPPAPPEYADKHMPEGWWADEKIIQEGKEIFIGKTNIDVNCASCHGKVRKKGKGRR